MSAENQGSYGSFAHHHSADLPGTGGGFDTRPGPAPEFTAAGCGEPSERAERRDAFMVQRERPEPELRPDPALAHASDRMAFNALWDAECRAAGEADREARRAAFMEMRSQADESLAQSQSRSETFNREARE
ncbi:hypothetical protein ACFOGJ_18025 [Marinibaculum pumilum]|uniref:Uncharacterized protein n=1 Tax=Marinibaculum pumilum TaxID=1766165 RepID=A0ABV7L400_9PROT